MFPRPGPLSPDTTYLVVGKVLAGRDRPDQAFMRVYRPESPPTEWEPAEWSVVSRIGRSWAAVTKAQRPPVGR